jgi:hypothetical protein
MVYGFLIDEVLLAELIVRDLQGRQEQDCYRDSRDEDEEAGIAATGLLMCVVYGAYGIYALDDADIATRALVAVAEVAAAHSGPSSAMRAVR